MDRTTKSEEKSQSQINKPENTSTGQSAFTADMRFIVTRNKRNVWLDDMYDTPPDSADLAIFN